ncbi:MAG: cyclodeaminase/cyclohydrolase family protein [Lachnospiraceae bacterium]|nr:cyclodeaminase/cyclohydrolase family protein [Candidatus Equihabitans merdae]
MAFENESLQSFSEALASKQSVPGGGGAAAYAGSLAAALGQMVLAFTIGKPKYEPDRAILEECCEKLEAARKALLEAIDKDAEAFEPLSKAYGMPKSTPEEEAHRNEVMAVCLKNAAEAPLSIVETCAAMAPVLKTVSEKGSPIMRSDAGCAALLFKAAMVCGAMNVMINTRLMKDKDTAAAINDKMTTAMNAASPVFESIADRIMESLK